MKARALVAVAVLVVTIPGAAPAHDHRPPRAFGVVDEVRVQRGWLRAYCWVYPAEGSLYVRECGDAVSRWPAPDWTRSDGRASLDLVGRHSPRIVRVLAWADAEATGPAEQLTFRHRRRGSAWRIGIQLSVPCRHYYVELHTLWSDAHGSGMNQDAIWQFHFRRPLTDEVRC